jgi:hypothetical protein
LYVLNGSTMFLLCFICFRKYSALQRKAYNNKSFLDSD